MLVPDDAQDPRSFKLASVEDYEPLIGGEAVDRGLVPFDEGTLTGKLTKDSKWPENDWRSSYFVPENLISSVEHADALKPLVPEGMTMAEMALRFILNNQAISTTIPGMRKLHHVEQNLTASDAGPLPADLHQKLKRHRWDREPTDWSQ
ncbi:MAG: aldo/keto reductase [Pseudolabrys sp.]